MEKKNSIFTSNCKNDDIFRVGRGKKTNSTKRKSNDVAWSLVRKPPTSSSTPGWQQVVPAGKKGK